MPHKQAPLLSFHNYYKLLQISEKAGLKEIQQAYRKIALKYHPDKMPQEENAEEYFKIVTKGYNILSNPRERMKYDLLLSAVIEEQKKNKVEERKYGRRAQMSVEEIRQKIENDLRIKRLGYLRLFKNRQKVLNHKIRYSILVLAALSGYLYVFNNWFVNEAGIDYFMIIIGFFIFGISTFFFFNHLFIHLRALNIIGKALKYPYEKTTVSLFIFIIITAPISIFGLNTFKKQYHLSHYSVLIQPLNVQYSHNKIVYSYYGNGELIYKSTNEYSEEKVVYLMTHKQLIIRVSKYNPKISRLEFVEIGSFKKYPTI